MEYHAGIDVSLDTVSIGQIIAAFYSNHHQVVAVEYRIIVSICPWVQLLTR